MTLNQPPIFTEKAKPDMEFLSILGFAIGGSTCGFAAQQAENGLSIRGKNLTTTNESQVVVKLIPAAVYLPFIQPCNPQKILEGCRGGVRPESPAGCIWKRRLIDRWHT
jgi:hypothetical protein